MRWISCLIALLIVLGWFATQIPLGGGGEVTRIEREHWVRTRYGWENASRWAPRPPVYQPRLHPLAVAVAEVLLSTTALLAFPSRRRERR